MNAVFVEEIGKFSFLVAGCTSIYSILTSETIVLTGNAHVLR